MAPFRRWQPTYKNVSNETPSKARYRSSTGRSYRRTKYRTAWQVIAEIPRIGSGKIIRYKLRDLPKA
jgi:acyl-coenzyme A synthetase/AMP-(fatty) acid ligase